MREIGLRLEFQFVIGPSSNCHGSPTPSRKYRDETGALRSYAARFQFHHHQLIGCADRTARSSRNALRYRLLRKRHGRSNMMISIMRDFTRVSAVALKALENDGKELAILDPRE